MPTRSFWAWGYQENAFNDQETCQLSQLVGMQFGDATLTAQIPPELAALTIPEPRLQPPDSLGSLFSTGRRDRAGHTYGKSFRDIVRGLNGDYQCAPDLIARPSTEQELIDVLDYASRVGAAVIPYGGGSSVVGGTEPRYKDDWAGTITVDMERFNRILEVDHQSRAALIEGGMYGPALEEGLRPHGYTLRHFPQSFEFSTLGGWIATRSGGHFATLYTHIDDLVESTRVVTPRGTLESRRLPGSGAGPSPDRLFLGSEGALGFVTAAWMRLQARPQYRATRSVHFEDFLQGAEAVRRLSQSGLYPTNCRLIDAREAVMNGIGTGSKHLLIIGFESADHPVDTWMDRALEIVVDAGGAVQAAKAQKSEHGQASEWRDHFIRAPYMRDALIRLGLVAETFETAITWNNFEAFHQGVMEKTKAVTREICGNAIVTCRFTHVYPDGPAPYYTVIAPGRRGDQVKQWDHIKQAVMETLIDLGGTITHHHAVGRDHMPGYNRQRPELFGEVLRATKKTLDPEGMLNPGVLV
jgi:alkyldihydroxyacetonephosphate synthase